MPRIYADQIEKAVNEPPVNRVYEDELNADKGSIQPKKKDFWASMGAEITPQMWEEHPYLAAAGKTAQDVATAPAHFVNQIAMNAPRAIMNRAGYNFAETDNPAANILAKTSGVAGMVQNPLNVVAGKAAALGKLPQAVGMGALAGAAYTPTEDLVGVKERLAGAALGGLGGGAFAVAPKIGPAVVNMRNNAASRVVNSLIKPLSKQFSYGKDPGRGVAREGITANSLEELQQKISDKRGEIGRLIGSAVKDSDKMVPVMGVLRPLDVALAKARKAPNTNEALINRLEAVREDLRGMLGGKDVQMATPIIANKIKMQIGELTKWTGNSSDDAMVNKALRHSYGRLKGRIEGVVPDIKDLNSRWADLMSAEIATKYRDVINNRQNIISLNNKLGGIAGTMIGLSTAGVSPVTALMGIGGVALDKAMASPMVKTTLAKWLSTATMEERQALAQQAPGLWNRIRTRIAGLQPDDIVAKELGQEVVDYAAPMAQDIGEGLQSAGASLGKKGQAQIPSFNPAPKAGANTSKPEYSDVPLWHGTNRDNAESIMKEGFIIGKTKSSEIGGAPNNYGDAIYLTANQDIARNYSTGNALKEHFSNLISDSKKAFKNSGDSSFIDDLIDEVPGLKEHLSDINIETMSGDMSLLDVHVEDPSIMSNKIFTEAKKFVSRFNHGKGNIIETLVNKKTNFRLISNAEDYAKLVKESSKVFPELSKQEAIKKLILDKGYDGIISTVNKSSQWPEYVIYNAKMLSPNAIKILISMGVTGLSLATEANASQPSDEEAINAILGEVGPYGKEGMQYVASALRNRNNGVKGVYGGKNPNVINKKYTQKQYEEAKQAWEDSKNKSFTDADHWFSDADLKSIKVKSMIKNGNMKFIRKVGGNSFYKAEKKPKK